MFRSRSYSLVLAALIFLPSCLVLWLAGFEAPRLVNFFPDDAFYYLQTAHNWAGSGSLSFDGENTTTGFHPLQMLLSGAVLAMLSKHGAMTFFFLLNPLCYVVSLFVFLKLFAVRAAGQLVCALAASFIFTVHIFAASAMESGLVVLVASLFFFVVVRAIEDSAQSLRLSAAVGALAALLFLSRLDMAMPLLILGLVYLFFLLRVKNVKGLALSLGGFLVLVCPYFWWMLQVQDSFMPVSSLAKYGRSQSSFSSTLRALTGGSLVGFSIFVLSLVPLLGAALYLLLKRPFARQPTTTVVGGILLSGFFYLFYTLFFAQEVFRWYLAYPSIVSVFALIFLVSRIDLKWLQPQIKLLYALPVLVLGLNCAVMIKYFRHETVTGSLLKTTLSINELVPPNSKIGTHDAGVIGYFSTSKVHNLDGLINSKANLDMFLREGRVIAYALHHKLDYLLLREGLIPAVEAEAARNGISLQRLASYDVTRMARVVLLKIQ